MQYIQLFLLGSICVLLYTILARINNIAYDIRKMREITQNITEDNIHYIREFFKNK